MAEPITDEQLDDIERRWRNHAGGPGPIGATVLQLVAELRTARVYEAELLAAIKRLAPEAARYDGRVYQIAHMPEFVTRFLDQEDIEANNEYPSDTDRRVLAERDELRRRFNKVLADLRNHVGAVLDIDTGEWLISTERVRAALASSSQERNVP